MQKRTAAIIIIIIATVALVAACKKSPPKPATNWNVPHALTDTFYYRALIDTTWKYHGDANKDECNGSSGVCSSFLYDATFSLSDSANPYPHDSIILSWVGKTFVTRLDTVPHPYLFKISYPDSLWREVSTENAPNFGSTLTITSIVHNGLSTLTPDSPGHSYQLYKIKGTFTANAARYQDTVIHKLTQGVFSMNVMESTRH